jgi:hypothetical protein
MTSVRNIEGSQHSSHRRDETLGFPGRCTAVSPIRSRAPAVEAAIIIYPALMASVHRFAV